MKTCRRCEINKNSTEFGRNKKNKDGYSIYCKECERIRGKNFRLNNPEYKLSSKKWRLNNPEKYSMAVQKYLNSNPHMTSTERTKKYRENLEYREKERLRVKKYKEKNSDKLIEYRKKYYKENKKVLLKKNSDYKLKRMKEDGFFRMKKNLRDRIRQFLMEEKKSLRTKNIVGLDSMNFKIYIEQKFCEGMNWENYGLWHLDHIKPLSMARNNQEVIELNHYTNLQPLWANDNLKKSNKYND